MHSVTSKNNLSHLALLWNRGLRRLGNGLLETLNFKDEENFEEEIWFEVFLCILKK